MRAQAASQALGRTSMSWCKARRRASCSLWVMAVSPNINASLGPGPRTGQPSSMQGCNAGGILLGTGMAAIADNLRFLRALISRPKNIGAVLPSGPALAQAIARQIPHGPVLELGPGTGAITTEILSHGIAPDDLTLVEYDEEFVRHNRARFPRVTIIQGDAFALDKTLGHRDQLFGAIVSGLPLLHF